MTRSGTRTRLLAVGLSALAGFVDALGFLELGGFFVSFMSGNTTRLGVALANGAASAWLGIGLVVLFVGGVMAGSLWGRVAGTRRRPAVLALIAALLAAAALCAGAGLSRAAVVAMVVAMGAENTVFEQGGEVRFGLTYMTGTLVKMGQGLTTALLGGERTGWLAHLWLWAGLLAGAAAGAFAYGQVGLISLWLPALVAALFAMLAMVPGGDSH